MTEPERTAKAGVAGVPLVSIGLPVFNGENYLAKTIDSILAQTFRDFELIIQDNASTDATASICQRYGAADPRIRYSRNPINLGAGPNYDLCFDQARGTYFKWAAHDDLLAPTYLEKAVAALEAAPEAVLCCVGITEIGPNDEVMRVYANALPAADGPSRAARFHALISTRHQCEDFFGLYRRAALVGSSLHGTYAGSDKVLLAEMALRGPFVKIPDPLFLHREHSQRYTRAILLGDRAKAVDWQHTAETKKKPPTLFHLTVYRHYWRVLNQTVMPLADRVSCTATLVRWWWSDYHGPDVVKDLLNRVSPSLVLAGRRAKRALFGTSKPTAGGLPQID